MTGNDKEYTVPHYLFICILSVVSQSQMIDKNAPTACMQKDFSVFFDL